MTAILAGDLPTAWKRTIDCPVGFCPLPRLALEIPATSTTATEHLDTSTLLDSGVLSGSISGTDNMSGLPSRRSFR